jgi:hypothetical protein
MNTFFLTLFSPVKAFNELKATDKFSAMSVIILLFLILVNLILMIPVTGKITEITMASMPLPEEQAEAALQMVYKMRYLQIVGSLFVYAIIFLLYTLLLYVLVRISKSELTFMKALQLIIYSYIVIVIGDLVNTAVIYARGLDSIQTIYDASLIGANMLVSAESLTMALYTFLNCINPFQIWFVVLLIIGLKVLTEMKSAKAVIICIIFWLITVAFPVASAYFSQTMMAKAGF